MSTKRQLRVSGAGSIANGAVTGSRKDLATRESAIAAIRAHCSDPIELAEAAADMLASRTLQDWQVRAAALLEEAGADPATVERLVAGRRAWPTGDMLGGIADGFNRQQPRPTL